MRIPDLAGSVAALAFALSVAFAPAVRTADEPAACDASGQMVKSVKSRRTVAQYDEKSGDVQKTVNKELIVTGVPIVACQLAPALVKVKLVDGTQIWVDRLEVEVQGVEQKGRRECVAKVPSRSHDTTVGTTAGIDPCSAQ